jgi:hypothetical protein
MGLPLLREDALPQASSARICESASITTVSTNEEKGRALVETMRADRSVQFLRRVDSSNRVKERI